MCVYSWPFSLFRNMRLDEDKTNEGNMCLLS